MMFMMIGSKLVYQGVRVCLKRIMCCKQKSITMKNREMLTKRGSKIWNLSIQSSAFVCVLWRSNSKSVNRGTRSICRSRAICKINVILKRQPIWQHKLKKLALFLIHAVNLEIPLGPLILLNLLEYKTMRSSNNKTFKAMTKEHNIQTRIKKNRILWRFVRKILLRVFKK